MKTYLSADILTPAQFKLIGVEFTDVEQDLQFALSIFAQAYTLDLLHAYYLQNPGNYQVTQPDQIIEIMKTRDPVKGADSPYPASLMLTIDTLKACLVATQREMEDHAERERKTKMAARDILDRVDKT